ncbi:MAG: DM13 domain-containing protein, partial [Thermoplasmata archaeon]
RVYLTQGPHVAAGDLDLGPLRASQGSSNYLIPGGVDPGSYRFVVIWCVPFSVQFGFAALTFT